MRGSFAVYTVSDARSVSFNEASVFGSELEKEGTMKALAILHWYNVLRVNYHFTAFQAIRFALWLAR
jgi:hypothetical protein